MDSRFVFKEGRELAAEKIVRFWRENGISVSATDTPSEIGKAAELHAELFIVAVERSGLIAGTVWGNFDGRRGFVVHLATRRDLRKAGLGQALMDELEARFRARGVWRIHLFVEKRNIEVVDYYLRRGYQVRDDLILMSRTLDPGRAGNETGC
jgi:ribosomal protein S18 acetylase RimI-like enzyme